MLWRGLAEVAEKYLKKGDSVYVEGKLRTRRWEDKEGNTKYTTEILADNMTMLGNKRSNDSEELSNANSSDISNTNETEDDLPF